ncbi:MAG: pitrilysin family protein [Candidatus Omnitrophica bacterium]|nr:pitrilysin family protein [Candidatus Omnitrophota bacterium]
MYEKLKTNNGLTVISSSMPQMSSVSLGAWIGVGGRYETEERSGISHLVEHMLFKGTHARSAKALKEAVEGVGGTFNGFTSDEVTCYMVKVPAKYTELGIDVLSDMVLNPRFDSKDLAKEKYVICEEIKMYRDQPSEYVQDLLSEIMWPNNALGRPLTGTISTVKSITNDEIKKFKEENYHPANISMISAGKMDTRALFQCVSEKFAKSEKKETPSFKKPNINQKNFNIKFSRKNTKQTHIAMGFHASELDTRERFGVKLMNVILGGNMSSRLFEELREKHGLCYDISSSYKRHSDVGEVHIHAGVDNSNAYRSIVAIIDELRNIRDLGVTAEELSRAKQYTKGQFLLAIEGTSNRMLWLGDRHMVHNDIPDIKKVLENIDNVTVEDIYKVCGKILRSEGGNLAMIGKLSEKCVNKIRKELAKL